MATTDPKEGMEFFELIGAAYKAAAGHEASLTQEDILLRKRETAQALAAQRRAEGMSEPELQHLLVLMGYGGLA